MTATLSCWFNGFLSIRKGDIVKITHAFPNTSPVRIAIMENVTEGATLRSPDCGVMMSIDYGPLEPEIMGRVLSSQPRSNSCEFMIEEGVYISNMFVKAGEKQKGQSALINILTNQMSKYVKIWDTWISTDTIKLLSSCPHSIDINLMTENICNESQVKTDAMNLSRNLKIRKRANMDHDRFILTQGSGWHVGHSLKDFGNKSSYLSKLDTSSEIESEFDKGWQNAQVIL